MVAIIIDLDSSWSRLSQQMADSPRFEPGDVVKFIQDEQALRDLQRGHGGWKSDMSNILGKLGTVQKVYPDGDIRVKAYGFTTTYNPDCVQLVRRKDEVDEQILTTMSTVDLEVTCALSGADTLELGDKVRILDDEQKVENLQENHGGWSANLRDFLGQEGEIWKVYKDGDLRVEVNRNRWTFNPLCLQLVSKRDIADVKFLASLSTKVSSQPKSSAEGLQTGDRVRIMNDGKAVRELQEKYGGWVSSMNDILGQEGTIKNIYEDGSAKVEVKGKIWTLSEHCLQFVPYIVELSEKEISKLKEISNALSKEEIDNFKKIYVVPKASIELSEPYDLLIALMSWSGHNPLLFYQALQEIRPDLVSLASEVPRLCDQYVSELDCIRYLIKMLKAELSTKVWRAIGSNFFIEEDKKSDADAILNKLFEERLIQKDLIKLLQIVGKAGRSNLANNFIAYQGLISKMQEQDFNLKFREALANQTIQKRNIDSSTIPINHTRFKFVYEQNKDSNGLALFVIFDIVDSDNKNLDIKLDIKHMERTLSKFGFECKCIRTNVSGYEKFLELFQKEISLIYKKDYSFILLLPIGDIASVKYSSNKLAYMIKNASTSSVDEISSDIITALIKKGISLLNITIPVIVFYTWISGETSKPPNPDIYFSENAFFCYFSDDSISDRGIRPYQLVHSLHEVLKDTSDQSLLLMELYIDVRNHYLNIDNRKSTKNILYSKNTLRNPLLINSGLSKLFFFVFKNHVLKTYHEEISDLIGKIKELFSSINYTVGNDIILTEEQSVSHQLEINRDIGKDYKSIFVFVIATGDTPHDISFGDIFPYELGKVFPKVPKVIFFNQITETLGKSPILPIQEDMLIAHSIEPNLSDRSFIKNFALEIQRNYYAELHAILRNTAKCSTNSSCVQIVDGFRKNFYVNYKCHLAHLLNKESSEFKRHYESACREGAAPFRFYRLMIVGPEDVGKTSLLRVLIGQNFKEEEPSTEFIQKYDIQVQKFSHDWSEKENLDTYIKNIEETSQDLAIKVVAEKMLKTKNSQTSEVSDGQKQQLKPQIEVSDPGEKSDKKYVDEQIESNNAITCLTKSGDDFAVVSESKVTNTGVPTEYPVEEETENVKNESEPFGKLKSSLDRIHSLGSKSDFFTAWDFAGQNYLYCFHSLFLSPRSVYLLVVDLTIKDLNIEIQERKRDDRNELRSLSGVPRTYLQVYEFWLNAIHSVSKTILKNGCTIACKVIFVFSKADQVEDPKNIAQNHLKSIKLHMQKKNNSFRLVYEENNLIILSCKTDSEYYENVYKLKTTIKQLSDKIAFEEPIPIKWLKFANEILREDQSILDKSRIQDLAEDSNCTEDIHSFLEFFHDIGFFFYKQGKIIVEVQIFLNLIYNVLFFEANESTPQNRLKEINQCKKDGKLIRNLFVYILECLNICARDEPILELLQLYGILIRCEPEKNVPTSYYVPYLQTRTMTELKKSLLPHTSFFVFFPDGFLPISLYFTLISRCILRNSDQNLPKSSLGFDCAIFYFCEFVLVSFEISTDRSWILVTFFSSNDSLYNNEDVNSEIMHYLIFLQLLLVEIQSTLIPCGNLARVMFICDSCQTLSNLEKGEKPKCSLDVVLSMNTYEFLLDCFPKQPIPHNLERFCCNKQLDQVRGYKEIMDQLNNPQYKEFKNSYLADLIINNQNIFVKYLKWREISRTLYSYGLIDIQIYSTILEKEIVQDDQSKNLLLQMAHKGPIWAIKFYFALQSGSLDCGHRTLLRFIGKSINKCKIEAKKEGSNILEQQDYPSTPTPVSPFMNMSIYTMNRTRHGIAFIVNIESFEDHVSLSNREGSKQDVASLTRVFDFLQYDIRLYEDLTRKEYLKAQREIQSLDHSEFDSFFCIIMSHGNENNEVIFSNGKSLSKDNIVNEFSPRYCTGLKSKPKIFIFQACRGKEEEMINIESDDKKIPKEILDDHFGSTTDKATNTSYNSTPSTTCLSSRQFSPPQQFGGHIDTFIGDSTVNQYVSYRSESQGTFFILSFCRVMLSCSNMEFTHIMMEVRREVSPISRQHRQCTEDTNRLQGPVYFF